MSGLLLLLTLHLAGLPVGGLRTTSIEGLRTTSIKVVRTTSSLRDFSGTSGLTLSPNSSGLSRLTEVTVCLRYSLHQCLEFQPLFGNGDFVIYQSGSLALSLPLHLHLHMYLHFHLHLYMPLRLYIHLHLHIILFLHLHLHLLLNLPLHLHLHLTLHLHLHLHLHLLQGPGV